MVHSFQQSTCYNLQSAILRVSSEVSSSSPAQYHQRPLRFRSLVMIGDHETRPTLVPTSLSDDFLSSIILSPTIKGGGQPQSRPVPSIVHDTSSQRTYRLHGKSDKTSSSTSRTNIGSTKTNPINNRHSSGDWLYNLWTIPRSSVLREIKNPILTMAGWATSISILHKAFLSSSRHVHWASRLCIPYSAHSFLVSSLGLLLVFRTNSAYQRFLVSLRIKRKVLSTDSARATSTSFTLTHIYIPAFRRQGKFGNKSILSPETCHGLPRSIEQTSEQNG